MEELLEVRTRIQCVLDCLIGCSGISVEVLHVNALSKFGSGLEDCFGGNIGLELGSLGSSELCFLDCFKVHVRDVLALDQSVDNVLKGLVCLQHQLDELLFVAVLLPTDEAFERLLVCRSGFLHDHQPTRVKFENDTLCANKVDLICDVHDGDRDVALLDFFLDGLVNLCIFITRKELDRRNVEELGDLMVEIFFGQSKVRLLKVEHLCARSIVVIAHRSVEGSHIALKVIALLDTDGLSLFDSRCWLGLDLLHPVLRNLHGPVLDILFLGAQLRVDV